MLKIGVLGAGHLGKIHLKLLKEIPRYEVVGFYDPSEEATTEAINQFNLKGYPGIDELITDCDVIDVVTPTLSHYDCAVKAIKNSKHVFIEKPITNTLEEAKSLIDLTHEANVKVQVGHVERFNPAFVAARPYIDSPMFVETHRLAQFNPRGTDVSVVLDLMIHDIDIVLSVVKSNIKKISANGVSVISDTPDITNARIEFDNSCVANLTASRISMKNMRKSRFFQRDAYISVDFLEKEVSRVSMSGLEVEPGPFDMVFDPGAGKEKKIVHFETPGIKDQNAIKQELESFADAILNNTSPLVPVDDGYNALDVAYKILDKLKLTANILA